MATEPLPAYLTVQECAALLRTTTKSVRNLIDRGLLPGVRRLHGVRRLLISRVDVLQWVECGAASQKEILR